MCKSLSHEEAKRRARNILKDRKDVIYDTTSYTKEQRDCLRNLAIENEAIPQVIYIDISRDKAYQRWKRNNQTNERFLVHIDDFDSVADNFEPPNNDENPIVYNSEENVSEWIKTNIIP